MLSDDEIAFRDAVAAFAAAEVKPRVDEMERAGRIDPALARQYFEMGLMGIEVPEQYGGAGGSLMMVTLAVEEVSKIDPAAAIMIDVQNTLVNYPITRYGSDAQKAKYLTRLTRDTVARTRSVSRRRARTHSGSPRGRSAEATGGSSPVGRCGSPMAPKAGIYVVFATTDPNLGYKGITAFIVEREMAGFAVGRKEDKLGIRASSTTELILDGVELPAENVLGPVGQGYKIAIETLNEGRIGIGAQMIGVAQGALAAATSYVKERQQFGRPLAEFQGIQFQLAQARTETEAARLMVYNAARLKDAGHDIANEGAMAKLFSSQVAERVTSVSLELFGGYGYTKDYPAEKFYRDAKIGAIYEGTSNMQLQTIAKGMLRE
jgi:butyryl-CoA dehydrogenase